MSEARRRQREGERRILKAARRRAKEQGCTCDVEIELAPSDHPLLREGLAVGAIPVTYRHDDWCPLLRVMEEQTPGPRGFRGTIQRVDLDDA